MSLCLCALCLFFCGSRRAAAESADGKYTSGDWEYELDAEGRATITGYYGNAEEIVLTDMDGHEIIAIGESVFRGDSVLKSMGLPDTVKSIGEHAFYMCSSLESMELSDTLGSIGDWAFYGCTSLELLELPDSLRKIGYSAFGYMACLKTMTIPGGVEEIGGSLLCDCHALKKLEILTPVVEFSDIATGCENLTEVTLPEGLKEVSWYAFYACRSLRQITLPKSLKRICYGAFKRTSLTSLSIPAGVTEIGEGALASPCLTEIRLAEGNSAFHLRPDGLYNTEGTLLATTVTEGDIEISEGCRRIGSDLFLDRDRIRSVWIPDSVREIGSYAFSGCSNLEAIAIGSQGMEYVGDNIIGGTKFEKDEENWEDGVCYLGTSAIESRSKEVPPILKLREGTALIATFCFMYNATIQQLWLPSSLRHIGQDAFANSTLQQVIGGRHLETIGGGAFRGVKGLRSLFLQADEILINGYAFEDCSNLREVVIDAQRAWIGDQAFFGTNLSVLVVPNLNAYLSSICSSENLSYVAITNMSLGDLSELGENRGFASDADNCTICVPYPKSAFPRGELSVPRGTKVLYEEEWHLCWFLVHDTIVKLEILPDGAELTSPIAEGEYYSVTTDGPVLSDIQWDLNSDGIPDELPDRIDTDIKAEAIYHVLEQEHNWVVKNVLQEQTCTQSGRAIYCCSGCGEEREITTEALKHAFDEEWTVDRAATCTAAGIQTRHCTREGCTERILAIHISKLEHEWDEGVITIEPQVGIEGERIRSCIQCQETKREVVDALAEPVMTPSNSPVLTETPVTETPGLTDTPLPSEPIVPTTTPEAASPSVSTIPEETPSPGGSSIRPVPSESAVPTRIPEETPSPGDLTDTPLPSEPVIPTMTPEAQGPSVSTIPETTPPSGDPAASSSPEESIIPTTGPSGIVPQPTVLTSPAVSLPPAGTEGSADIPAVDGDIVLTPAAEETAVPDPPTSEKKSDVISKTLKIKSDYRKITLRWTAKEQGVQYWIYRSGKKNSKKTLLKKIKAGKGSYIDRAIKAGRTYYYCLQVMQEKDGTMECCGSSGLCRASLRVTKAPSVTIRRKQASDVRYLEISLSKYSGKCLEIYYRKNTKGKYQKVKLRTAVIPRDRKFRILYTPGRGNMYLKFRTYGWMKRFKVYSGYTRVQRVRT